MKAYQAENPGHCGLCGLPMEHCFHRKAEYRKETDPCKSARAWRTLTGVQDHWYLSTLNKMCPAEVRLLPMPPKKRWVVILQKWLEDHPERRTWYQRIVEES